MPLQAYIQQAMLLETNLEPRYTIDYKCPIPWPKEKEPNIGVDYPFTDYVEESAEEYIIQRYLEALWFPDSITCLISFIKILRRIRIKTDMDPRHLFEPLLLPVEAIREKYHVQLVRVLQEEDRDRLREEGIEETMMWFAYGNEKRHWQMNTFEGEAVHKEWFTNMEHREMKIQVLLCFHILFLQKYKGFEESILLNVNTAPLTTAKKKAELTKCPTARSFLSPKKPAFPPTESMSIDRKETAIFSKKKSSKGSPVDIEERLELLMDRLSIAQLMANLQTTAFAPIEHAQSSISAQVSQDTQRDWMQAFCEDIVKPLFQEPLPTFYNLLHSKVFSHSPFSEESEPAMSSPVTRLSRKFKARERLPPSPLKLHEVTKPRGLTRTASAISGSKQSGTQERQNQVQHSPSPLLSHPYRSRSVSVSVEEVRARGASRGGVSSSKVLFRGEFDMKKSYSKSGRLFQSSATSAKVTTEGQYRLPKPCALKGKEPKSSTLALDTPVKKQCPIPCVAHPIIERRNAKERPEFIAGHEFEWSSEEDATSQNEQMESVPQIFVMDTPVKSREV